jgi:hypothetical protein
MAEAEALLAFPCPFPIKVLGRREPEFAQQVMQIVLRHAPDFEPATVDRAAALSQPRLPCARRLLGRSTGPVRPPGGGWF